MRVRKPARHLFCRSRTQLFLLTRAPERIPIPRRPRHPWFRHFLLDTEQRRLVQTFFGGFGEHPHIMPRPTIKYCPFWHTSRHSMLFAASVSICAHRCSSVVRLFRARRSLPGFRASISPCPASHPAEKPMPSFELLVSSFWLFWFPILNFKFQISNFRFQISNCSSSCATLPTSSTT